MKRRMIALIAALCLISLSAAAEGALPAFSRPTPQPAAASGLPGFSRPAAGAEVDPENPEELEVENPDLGPAASPTPSPFVLVDQDGFLLEATDAYFTVFADTLALCVEMRFENGSGSTVQVRLDDLDSGMSATHMMCRGEDGSTMSEYPSGGAYSGAFLYIEKDETLDARDFLARKTTGCSVSISNEDYDELGRYTGKTIDFLSVSRSPRMWASDFWVTGSSAELANAQGIRVSLDKLTLEKGDYSSILGDAMYLWLDYSGSAAAGKAIIRCFGLKINGIDFSVSGDWLLVSAESGSAKRLLTSGYSKDADKYDAIRNPRTIEITLIAEDYDTDRAMFVARATLTGDDFSLINNVVRYPALARGDESDAVRRLQSRLIDLGYLRDSADGVYGGKTEIAVKDFQAANGVSATGVADDITQNILFGDSAQAYCEPDVALALRRPTSYGSWREVSGNRMSFRAEVENISAYRTVKAFEMYCYPVDQWGDPLLQEGYVYNWTTAKVICPGQYAATDDCVLECRSEIAQVYCGVKRVIYDDGAVEENADVNYGSWDICW